MIGEKGSVIVANSPQRLPSRSRLVAVLETPGRKYYSQLTVLFAVDLTSVWKGESTSRFVSSKSPEKAPAPGQRIQSDNSVMKSDRELFVGAMVGLIYFLLANFYRQMLKNRETGMRGVVAFMCEKMLLL